jgi:hypothetical protein
MRDILEEAFKTFWAEDPRRGAIGSVPDALLADCLRFLPESVLRIYVCDKSGIQLSGHVERLGLDIVTFKERKGQNLAWRGYFQKTLEAFEAGHTDYLSPAYRDLNTKSRIFTYARLVDDGGILLMDILRVPEESAGAAGL